MIYFYRFMLWATELDLRIARSTGRNPAEIAQLTTDRDRWESLVITLELNDA